MIRQLLVALIVGGVFIGGTVVAVLQLFDGKGPGVHYIPVKMRPWVNRFWVRHGWPAPFDADLNKIPRRDR